MLRQTIDASRPWRRQRLRAGQRGWFRFATFQDAAVFATRFFAAGFATSFFAAGFVDPVFFATGLLALEFFATGLRGSIFATVPIAGVPAWAATGLASAAFGACDAMNAFTCG